MQGDDMAPFGFSKDTESTHRVLNSLGNLGMSGGVTGGGDQVGFVGGGVEWGRTDGLVMHEYPTDESSEFYMCIYEHIYIYMYIYVCFFLIHICLIVCGVIVWVYMNIQPMYKYS